MSSHSHSHQTLQHGPETLRLIPVLDPQYSQNIDLPSRSHMPLPSHPIQAHAHTTHNPPLPTTLGSPMQISNTREGSPQILSSDELGRDDEPGNEDEDDDSLEPPKKRRRSRKGLGKRFVCQCGRGYSRAEHLSRHQLNHKPKEIYYCDFPACDRTFVRADLCERHKQRHRRGNGELDGPSIAGAELEAQSNPTLPYDNNANMHVTTSQPSADVPPSLIPDSIGRATPSPQRPMPSASMQHPQSDPKLQNPQFSPPKPDSRRHQFGLSPVQNVSSYSQTQSGIDQVAISDFTSPVLQNYTPQYQSTQISHQEGQSSTLQIAALSATPQKAHRSSVSYDPSDGAGARNGGYSSYGIETFGYPGRSPPHLHPDDLAAWLLGGDAQQGAAAGAVSSVALGFQAPFFAYDAAAAAAAVAESNPELMELQSQIPAAIMFADLTQANIPSTQVQHIMTEPRRQQILEVLRGRSFDGDIDSVFDSSKDDGNVLSLGMMQRYIDGYWEYIQPQVPIIHKPTFITDSCPVHLLLSVIMLGASCMEKRYGLEVTTQCAALSRYIAIGLRWELFRSIEFGPPAQLWILQALLLLELYEKQLSSRALHERAHVHHATALTLMRRGSSLDGEHRDDPRTDQSGSHAGPLDPAGQAEARWNAWITTEGIRRVAFAAFVIDALHASMFGHNATIAAHELRLPLPCDDNLWNANTWGEMAQAESRLVSRNEHGPVFFLDALRSILAQQPVRATGFGRMALMAGLLSVGWQLQQRDLQARSLGSPGVYTGAAAARWKTAVTRGVDFWQQDFERAVLGPSMATPLSGSAACSSGGGAVGGMALSFIPRSQSTPITSLADADTRAVLYHLAQMTIHVDVVDCQILAGAKRLLGRPVTAAHYIAGKNRLAAWAPSVQARAATFAALSFLSETLLLNSNCPSAGPPTPSSGMSGGSGSNRRRIYTARDDPHIHRPWAVYVATLTVWAYGYSIDGPFPNRDHSLRKQHALNEDPEAAWADMHDFLLKMGALSPAPVAVQRHASNAQLATDEHARLTRQRQQQQRRQSSSTDQHHQSAATTPSHHLPPLPPAPPQPQTPPVGSSEALALLPNRNRTIGLMIIVKTALQTARWELMSEASRLLDRAIGLSCGLELDEAVTVTVGPGTGPA